MRDRGLSCTLTAAVMLAMAGAQAQALTDPMRPPAAVGAATGAQDAAPTGKNLQSILLSRGRKLAVIDGNTIPLGGMVGEAKLVSITEAEVVLKKGDETEVLKLFPGVDKRPTKRRGGRSGSGSGSAGPVSTSQGGSK